MASNQPIQGICLMGPTATGKTELAIQLHDLFPTKIISVDSALVYRDMNIGTAKPDAGTLQKHPHSLIDIRNPDETYSAAEFCSEAQQEIQQSLKEDKIPLLVGGTMMYFHSLIEGIADLPAADPEIRKRLQKKIEAGKLFELHAKLAEIDPISARNINANDSQRIQRAIEVFEITGVPLSTHHQTSKSRQPFDLLQIALMPTDRNVLHQRIAKRFADMLAAGLLDEIIDLKKRYPLSIQSPSMRCVGYRQAWQHLEGLISKEALLEKGVIATRQLAKRQMTWIRNHRNTLVVPIDFNDPGATLSTICKLIESHVDLRHPKIRES